MARLIAPAWLEELNDEGVLRLRERQDADVDESEYILVEDNRADVTIYVFSGLDGLFGGGRRFEFRNTFANLECRHNLVFVRELRGFAYHVCPNGAPNGLEFYEHKLNEVKQRLGSTWNIAMGFSSGGAAATYFGTRCHFDKILAFCPAFPFSVYTSAGAQIRHWCNVKKLLLDPLGYVDLTVITLMGLLLLHRMKKVVRPEQLWDVLATYRDCPSPRPRVTLAYGSRCRQDTVQAMTMAGFPEVELRPVPTGIHGVPTFLKKQGLLGEFLLREIRDSLPETVNKR